MPRPNGCRLALVLLAALPAVCQAAGDDRPTNATVITSTRLSFDQQQRTAVFEDQVEVRDRDVNIRADRLTVQFTADHKVDRIEADGRVVIVRDDVRATGAHARYDMRDGKLQLTGNPRLQRGQDVLTGDTITLWRESQRILCEPNARLVIVSDPDVFDAPRK